MNTDIEPQRRGDAESKCFSFYAHLLNSIHGEAARHEASRDCAVSRHLYSHMLSKRIVMFAKFAIWIKQRSSKKRYWRYYDLAAGDDFAKTCTAFLMMELENETVRAWTLKHPAEQRKTFLMAYECFIMWLIKFNVGKNRPQEFVVQLVGSLRDSIRDCGHYEKGVFEEIWEAVQDAMPNSLTPGQQTGVAVPWVHVVTMCNVRGIEIQSVPDYRFIAHVMMTFKRVHEFVQMILSVRKNSPSA